MSLNEYEARQAFWRLQPHLVAQARRMSEDLNEAYERVHRAVLSAARLAPPEGLSPEAWAGRLLSTSTLQDPHAQDSENHT